MEFFEELIGKVCHVLVDHSNKQQKYVTESRNKFTTKVVQLRVIPEFWIANKLTVTIDFFKEYSTDHGALWNGKFKKTREKEIASKERFLTAN